MCKQEVKLGREHSKGSSPALSPPQEEAGQVLLLKGGVYWDSPSTAVPALEDVMICKNLSASLQVCSRESAAAKCAHMYTKLLSMFLRTYEQLKQGSGINSMLRQLCSGVITRHTQDSTLSSAV